ncbi:MAG: XdhC family protein [Chloroflexi bacterium]|nr:XdhC family protein [Chloroflexota bacterium]
MNELWLALAQVVEANEVVALATVVEAQGSSPAKAGFKALIWPDGRLVGNVGGGALEQRIRADAQAAMQRGDSSLVHYALREEGPAAVGMVCGGDVRVFIEVLGPPPALLIVGGGFIGQPLAEMARLVGFRVQVVDPRPARGDRPALTPDLLTAQTYLVVATEDQQGDLEALRVALGSPAAYIGMVGSRRKTAAIFDDLRRQGVAETLLASVHAPVGLDLGGSHPAEIALSILAEVVAVRHGGSGRPLYQQHGDAGR